jgi:hypothetical protein
MRLMGILSEDKNLIEAYKEKQDIHAYTASLLFGITVEDAIRQKEYRHVGKTINFGMIYSMGASTMANDLAGLLDPQQAKNVLTKLRASFVRLKDRFPEIKEIQKAYYTQVYESSLLDDIDKPLFSSIANLVMTIYFTQFSGVRKYMETISSKKEGGCCYPKRPKAHSTEFYVTSPIGRVRRLSVLETVHKLELIRNSFRNERCDNCECPFKLWETDVRSWDLKTCKRFKEKPRKLILADALQRIEKMYYIQKKNISESKRQAINMPIQSIASDITLMSLIKIDKVLTELKLNAGIVCTVHDSIVVECPEDEIEIVADIGTTIMRDMIDENDYVNKWKPQGIRNKFTNILNIDMGWMYNNGKMMIQMDVDTEIGTNWGNLKSYQRQ